MAPRLNNSESSRHHPVNETSIQSEVYNTERKDNLFGIELNSDR